MGIQFYRFPLTGLSTTVELDVILFFLTELPLSVICGFDTLNKHVYADVGFNLFLLTL